MIVHVVLFSPKPDLSAADRAKVLDALASASKEIPSIKRLRIGRREFDDLAGLTAYLQHPAHAAAGHHFTASASKALAYDYEVAESLITDHSS